MLNISTRLKSQVINILKNIQLRLITSGIVKIGNAYVILSLLLAVFKIETQSFEKTSKENLRLFHVLTPQTNKIPLDNFLILIRHPIYI